jgi:hypothetical protein
MHLFITKKKSEREKHKIKKPKRKARNWHLLMKHKKIHAHLRKTSPLSKKA